jgi:actin-related protein
MLLSNMMLSGGSACIDGLSERLKSEGTHPSQNSPAYIPYVCLHLTHVLLGFPCSGVAYVPGRRGGLQDAHGVRGRV